MEKNELERYNDVIRQLIIHENEIRDYRNNWQFTINGFMVAGYIAAFVKQEVNYTDCICIVIAIMGIFISISFLYAAWRSRMAVSMALSCWNLMLEIQKERIINYPPVCLITENIIKNITVAGEDNIGINEWNHLLNGKIMKNKKEFEKWRLKTYNKIDVFMPYVFMPKVFLLLWIILFLLSLKNVI